MTLLDVEELDERVSELLHEACEKMRCDVCRGIECVQCPFEPMNAPGTARLFARWMAQGLGHWECCEEDRRRLMGEE